MCVRLRARLCCLLLVGAAAVVCPGETSAQRLSGRGGVTVSRQVSPLTSARSYSLTFSLAPREALSVQTGYHRFSSFPDDTPLKPFGKSTWKLRAVPITVAYQYTFGGTAQRFNPFVEAGLSYYLCRVRTYHEAGDAARMPDHATEAFTGGMQSRERTSDMGMGYGLHTALGLRTALSPELFLTARTHLRYVNGLGLTAPEMPAEFFRADFSLGVGYQW